METYSNKLNDDLLKKVQASPNEARDDNFVNNNFPVLCCLVATQVVVLHGWEEGDFDCKSPEKERGGNLQCFAKVSPLLIVISEQTGN